MINPQEIIFAVDPENNPIEPQPRIVAHKNGVWHRTTGIWVINSKKQILCQKRSLNKDIRPGMWEAFMGGHLAPGEEYLENAAGEVSQELGIKARADDLIFYKTLRSDKPTHKEFQSIFALVTELPLAQFHFEKEEVDELEWKDLGEVRKILLVDKDSNWVQKPWDEDVLNWIESLG